MNRKQEIFEKVLKNSYEHEEFVGFVKEFLTKTELVAPNRYEEEKSNFSTFVNGYYHIGNYISDNLDKIIILSVCLNKGDTVERARGMQRNFVKSLIDNSNSAGAIVAFYTKENPEKWRLSFIRMDYEFSKGKVTEKLTPAKRYSYLVGKDEPCHTAMSRLYPIFSEDNKNPNIDAIEEAFSVETVTKEFFNEYCEKFYQLRDYLESNEHFMIEASVRNFTSEQFAKKLLGQIVFLYFIQKKGWLGVDAIPTALTEKEYKNAFFSRGSKSREVMDKVYKLHESGNYRIVFSELQNLSDDDEAFLAGIVKGKPWGSGPKDFMRRIFDGCISARKNYFDDYLEPLFYTGLNKNRGDNGFYAPLHRRIPFLNGGLFEQLDNYEWENNNFAIPNELFSNREQKGRDADGILDIFDRYNFTMNEDEPMEREVAIDPEMLGKVFENLLDVKDRKSKGAFYTPREIVHYMCQETLINHLVNKTGLRETDIRDFILYGDLMKDEDTVKSIREGRGEMLISSEIFDLRKGVNRLKELDDILANVKVADLAVGSGAFPLGMLNEIVKARETLSAYMSIGMNGFQKKSFYAYERKPYILKMNTIKNCIFACDIEPSAVDIAKLRLWLSIVIDDEISDEMGNGDFDAHTQPRQLPNLDCNIICGNSLIDEFKENKLITESEVLHNVSSDSQIGMFQGGVDTLVNELIKLQDKLFYIKDHDEKEDTKNRINKIYNEIVLEQIHGNPELVKGYLEAIEKPSKPFILWQLYFPQVFRDNAGFDIVIGNPPYLKEIDYKEIFAPILKTQFGMKYGEGKMNFWYFFFHKGLEVLNMDGLISFIAPNYFVAGSGASKLNERFVKETAIKSYIDFNKTKVFDTADVQCMIFVNSKNIEKQRKPFNAYFLKNKVEREQLGKIINKLNGSKDISIINVENQEDIYLTNGKINFANAKYSYLLDQIEKHKSKRKLFKATQGIVENPSNLNKKNIGTVADTGVDVSNYFIGEEVFVISKDTVETLGLSSEERKFLREYHEPNEVNRYYCNDSFNKYLLYICRENCADIDLYPNIKRHLEKYRPFMELRRETIKGTVQWFQLHWPRKEELFIGEKVVYPQMGEKPVFAYSDKPFFTNMSANIVYACEKNVNLKIMTCVLNSKMAHFWLLHRAKNRGIGLDIAVTVVDEFPIDEEILSNEELRLLANQVIEKGAKKEDYTEVDTKIDNVIFKLYGFGDAEIEVMIDYINERTMK